MPEIRTKIIYNAETKTQEVVEYTVSDEQLAEEAIQQANYAKQERMNEIIQELNATDFKAIKFAEGAYTEIEFAPIRTARQALRDEYNALETELTTL